MFWLHFKANFRRLCLQKWRSLFWFEFLVVLLLLGGLVAIKSTSKVIHRSPESYFEDGAQVPSVDDLFTIPNLTAEGFDTSKAWYLRNWENFRAYDDILSDVNNIAFSCKENFGSIQDQVGFLSMCELSKIAIIPDNIEDQASSKAADDFRMYWGKKSTILIEQKRFEGIDSIVDTASLNDYVEHYRRGEGKFPIGLAIVFTSGAPNWRYIVRLPRGALSNTVNRFPTTDISKGATSNNFKWIFSGFLTAQTAVDDFIFSQGGVPEGKTTKYSGFAMPTYAYGRDTFWSSNSQTVGLFFLLTLILPMSNVILGFVRDKETKWRELTSCMGMSQSAYLFSWLIFWLIEFFLIACTMMILSRLLFPYSNLWLIFFLLLSYSLNVMCFSFMIASVFDRATIANVVAILLFFGMNNVRTIFKDNVGLAQLGGISVMPPVAVTLAIETIGEYETNLEGLSFWDPGYNSTLHYSVLFSIAMLVGTGIVFLILGLYLDAVVPPRGGLARKPPLFFLPKRLARILSCNNCFRRSKTVSYDGDDQASDDVMNYSRSGLADSENRYLDICSQIKSNELDQARESNLFENVSDSHHLLRRQGRCVLVNNIEKIFGEGTSREIRAVNGLTTTFFENEISVLLGHNGAGKSTTDSILTGLVRPTSGEVFIYGKSVSSDMSSIRQSLGLCPQKNVALDSLTVKEHLEYMAAIKMIPKDQVSTAVRDIIESVALTQKTDTRSKALSGGMKRKLQLAMALLGDNKVCILDEPTSGMDTYARIATQKCLERHRAGRVMVLTTHYMDEADLLGDRIVVLSKGKAQCSGSTLFLKSALGVGYNLVVQTRKNSAIQNEIVKEVKKWIPESQEADNSGSGTEVIFRLPLTSSTKFESMLRSLENPEFKVINTSIGVTTLESVFLRLLEGVEGHSVLDDESSSEFVDGESLIKNSVDSIKGQSYPEDPEDGQEILTSQEVKPLGAVAQLNPLFAKRLQTIRRDKRAWCCQIATPLLFLIVGFCLLNIKFIPEDNGYVLNEETDGWNFDTGNSNPIPFNLGAGGSISPSDTIAFMNRLSMPRLLPQAVDDVGNTSPFCTTMSRVLERLSDSYTSFLRDVATSVQTPGIDLPTADKPFDIISLILGMLVSSPVLCHELIPVHAPASKAFNLFLNESRYLEKGSRYAGVLFNKLSNSSRVLTDITIAYNFTAVYAMPLMINRLNEAFLHEFNSNYTITTITQTLPYDSESSGIYDGILALLTGMCLCIAFGFVGAGYVVFIVREKESGAWHQQLINGVNPWSYIVSNILFDSLIYIFNLIVALVLIYSFGVTEFISNISTVLVLLILFGLLLPPFVYCSSFFFGRATTAQLALVFLNLVGAVVLPLASYVMDYISATKDVNAHLMFVYRLIPAFCFSHGFINVANIKYFQLILNEEALESIAFGNGGVVRNYTGLDWEIAGYDVLYLGCETIFFSILLVVLQLKVRSGLIVPNLGFLKAQKDNDEGKQAGQDIQLEDADVIVEGERVANVDVRSEAVVVRNLRKVYPNGKVAVKKLSFGIHKNEVFGLLGTNGAGKTTALKIISGEIKPSNGEVFVNGIDAVDNPQEAQRSFGFCPQFDALFDLLTGRECLTFYARMKGIHKSLIDNIVNGQISRFGLTDHADRLCGSYSGGNKRKLSVAQATMGAPAVVVLDEPSAGLDIAARHELHKAISSQVRTSTVVLTTHSMEECEALSDRIAIQVDGRLRCIGSSHHLKTTYGTGFQLEINFLLPTHEQIVELASKKNLGNFDDKQDSLENVMKLVEALGRMPDGLAENDGFGLIQDQFHHEGFVTTETIASWHLLENSFDKAVEIFSNKFDNLTILERLAARARFVLPMDDGNSLSAMFGFIESVRDEIGIETYSLGQTTLEQIFNMFAMTQSEKVDD